MNSSRQESAQKRNHSTSSSSTSGASSGSWVSPTNSTNSAKRAKLYGNNVQPSARVLSPQAHQEQGDISMYTNTAPFERELLRATENAERKEPDRK